MGKSMTLSRTRAMFTIIPTIKPTMTPSTFLMGEAS